MGRSVVDMPERPTAATLGELRASGHRHRPVKTEVRENLLAGLLGMATLFTLQATAGLLRRNTRADHAPSNMPAPR